MSRDVIINGERRAVTADTLRALLMSEGYAEAHVATALNGVFVSALKRGATALADGDRIEIVSARQGG